MNKRQRLIFRWSLLGILTLGGSAALTILLLNVPDPGAGFKDDATAGVTRTLERRSDARTSLIRFEDVTDRAQLHVSNFAGPRTSQLPEDMGSGLAWGDYNNDGLPDLYVNVFSHNLEKPLKPGDASGRLFENLGNGTFKDVTQSVGLGLPGFDLGASWGDYDNDGFLDLFVTSFGKNHLYHNNAGKGFTDVTSAAGMSGNEFSASSAWADFDGDGLLDLYVANYVKYIPKTAAMERQEHTNQYGQYDIPFSLNPSSYAPEKNHLYHNLGNGKFKDVASAAGVADRNGRSLGVLWTDFDADGAVDLYVANDISSNAVYHNRGNGTFADIGASSLAGDYRGAMGLASTDLDGDGDFEIMVTHWLAQENALYMNMSADKLTDAAGHWRLFFMDEAELHGLGQSSLDKVGWATGFDDFDNNGRPDLWIVNGDTMEATCASASSPCAQQPLWLKPQTLQVLDNIGDRGFYPIADSNFLSGRPNIVGRGGASADFDGDGRVDLALLPQHGPAILLKNVSDSKDHWLGLRLRQTHKNRFAIGARGELVAGNQKVYFEVGNGTSYLSQNSLDIHIGLGQKTAIDQLKIHWPDGRCSVLKTLNIDQINPVVHTDRYAAKGRVSVDACLSK